MNVMADESGNRPCPLCETSAKSDAGYFTRAFSEPRLLAATRDTMTDALGFCARHGASLLSQERFSGGFAHVIHDAIPRLMLLLNEEYLRESWVQETLFGADSACPACAYANRAVRRHAASLARWFSGAEEQARLSQPDILCIGHFQMLAADLAPEARLAGLIHYSDNLKQVARAINALLRRARETDAWALDEAPATLNHVLGLISGRPAFEPPNVDGGLANALKLCPTFVEAIPFPEACPLCVETERARQRWLQNVQRAAGFRQDAWLLFPTCPEHVRAVARLCEPGLTAAVVSRALSVALRYLHHQVQALVRAAELKEEEARIKAEGPSAWDAYMRKRAKQKTEGRKDPSHGLAKCPGCERIDIAADRGTGSLLDLLQQKNNRKAFSQGYGLCMKHFARVYPIAPKGVVRSMLAEDQKGRLAEFTRSISDMDPAMPETETTMLRNISRKQTLRRFCGFT